MMIRLNNRLHWKALPWLLAFITVLVSTNLSAQSKEELHRHALDSDSVVQEGIIRTFYKNGDLRTVGYAINKPYRELGYESIELKVGTWKSFHKTGALYDSIIFDSKSVVLEKYLFNNKGNCYYHEINKNPSKTKFKFGSKETFNLLLDYERAYYFSRTGTIKSKSQYQDGKLHGSKKLYFRNGRLRKEKLFERGKRIRLKKVHN